MLLFCLPFFLLFVFHSLSSFTIIVHYHIHHRHRSQSSFVFHIHSYHSQSSFTIPFTQPSFTSTFTTTTHVPPPPGPSTTAARSTVFNVGAGDGGCREPRARPVLRIVVGVLRPEKQTEKRGRGGIERAQCIDAEHVTLVEGRKIMLYRENRIQ